MRLYLLIGAALVIAIAAAVYFFAGPSKPAPAPADTTTSFPVASSTSVAGQTAGSAEQLSLAGQAGTVVVTKDFLHNNETIPDVVNPGFYILAGSLGYCLADGTCPSGAPTNDFVISYNSSAQFFNIVLLAEPLGPIRTEAEQFMLDRLGITQTQACNLDYFITAPTWVNTIYGGKNLGFSFCPGATKLPQ